MNVSDYVPHAHSLGRTLEQAGVFELRSLREAFFAVPRHLFIDRYYERPEPDGLRVIDAAGPTEQDLRAIYADSALMVRQPPDHSSCSQPQIVLAMLHDLDLAPGSKVLEIGTGTGWNAGLMAAAVGSRGAVYSVDIEPDLVDAARGHLAAAGLTHVLLRAGDGGYGWSEAAPFDRIIVTVGSPDVTPAWMEQLADNGVLLLPLAIDELGNPVLRLRKTGGELKGEFTRWSGFYPLRGNYASNGRTDPKAHASELVERLLQTEPVTVDFTDPWALHDASELFLFLHVCGSGFEYVAAPQSAFGGGLLEVESGSLCVVSHGDPQLRVFGNPASRDRFMAYYGEWVDLGRPRVSDYRVEVLAPDYDCEGEWLDRRGNACLRYSLRTD